MGLVDYTDSEDESVGVPDAKMADAEPTKNPEGQARGKKRFALPEIRPEEESASDKPSAKKARTGGMFSGLSSRLAEPKKKETAAPSTAPPAAVPPQTATGNAFAKKRFTSLKTGAQPSFARTSADHDAIKQPNVMTETQDSFEPDPEYKGKVTMFTPDAVIRARAQAKKSKQGKRSAASAARPGAKASSKPQKSKSSSVALFGDGPEAKSDSTPDEPFVAEDDDIDMGNSLLTDSAAPEMQLHPPPQVQQNPNDLNALADSLNMTAAQRRQFFGRGGTANPAVIKQFNLSREYESNRQQNTAGEGQEQPATVRAIKPGRHNLRQLVSNAVTQQSAFDDMEGEQQRKQRERGDKYGF